MPLVFDEKQNELEIQLARISKMVEQVVDFSNANEKRVIDLENTLDQMKATLTRFETEMARIVGRLEGQGSVVNVNTGETNVNNRGNIQQAIGGNLQGEQK